MATTTQTALHYFVAIGDDLTPVVVGTSNSANGPKALIAFADERYGYANWDWRLNGNRKYIVSRESGECLSVNPFPEWMV